MTRTVRTSLGASPLTGKHGIDQTRRFKDQLRSLQKKPVAVSLLTVVSVVPPNLSVEAVYDADDPDAVAWVKQAQAVAPDVWKTMAERRKGPGRT